MKKIILFSVIFIFIISTLTFAMKIKGVNLPETVKIGSTKCYLNGAGIRKKFFFSIYVIGLYLPVKMSHPSEIINLDKNKGVIMVFTYHKISPKKIQNAWKEGFEKNVKDLTALDEKIKKFNSFFNDEVKKGDKFIINYLPDKGTCVYINDNFKGCIEGKDFMEGLFSIWLGEKPISKGLKKKLLGK